MTWHQSKYGYNEEYQLVREDGRIMGFVSGSTFELSKGWFAADESSDTMVRLGRFVTLDDAKQAVFTAVDARAAAAQIAAEAAKP